MGRRRIGVLGRVLGRPLRAVRRRLRGPVAAAAGLVLVVLAFQAAQIVEGLPEPAQAPAAQSQSAAAADARLDAPSAWDPDACPDYYRVVGTAVVDDVPEAGTASYEPLDRLGRAGRVVANVTYQMMEEGSSREREDISSVEPSGWGHNEQVSIPLPDGQAYSGYLYNRSHLLAKSLGGIDDVTNLVTGTRTQNVGDNRGAAGGMAFTEGLARDWLRAHRDGTVYYSATPLYVGGELLPRSVVVDVRTSDGTVDLEVEVYNTALGFDIDYVDGSFSPAGE